MELTQLEGHWKAQNLKVYNPGLDVEHKQHYWDNWQSLNEAYSLHGSTGSMLITHFNRRPEVFGAIQQYVCDFPDMLMAEKS